MLFNGLDNPQKLPFRWGILTPSNTRFLWPSGISISSAIIAVLTNVIREIDQATSSVANGYI